MAVILKKDEKVNAILDMMSDITNADEFAKLFLQQYPDDYSRIQKTYNKEEWKDKKGKGHPMPCPDTYLRNMYNVAIKKRIDTNN